MLLGTETPRPRPPAKVRRSASMKRLSSPPPSYAAAFEHFPDGKLPPDSLLGSPLMATFQRVGWDRFNGPLSPTNEEDQNWINEKSREELSDLLVKAEDLIRERESDLGMASVVCKNLYENNVALKNKHQALLKRLPPSPSPLPSPELPSRLTSRYSISLNRPVYDYESSQLSHEPRARKISLSSNEISRLADQNAELLGKLERMETDAVQADQVGRRELKRLEKEIHFLREELEKTQAKSLELEEKTKKAEFGWDTEKAVQEVWKKKEEREARILAMRNAKQIHVEHDYEVVNFAPDSGLGASAHSKIGSRRVFPLSKAQPFHNSTSSPEHSVISQLLEKIQELEQTNTRIIEQQSETVNQLNAMQRETEHISKIYECFADEDIIEVMSDLGPEEQDQPSSEDTIRFGSLKRIARMAATPVNDIVLPVHHAPTNSRARKSVMGLFSTHEDTTQDDSSPPSTSRLRPSLSTGSPGLVSPALSTRSLTPSRSQPLNSSHRTLEAELGENFDNDWGLNSNNHLRTNSLYALSQISAPPSPSLSPMALKRPQSTEPKPFPILSPVKCRPLHLSIEPPTPEKAETEGETMTTSVSRRYQRLSETVRLRTSRWNDGRFKDTLTSLSRLESPVDQEEPDGKGSPRQLTPLSLRLTSAFESAILNETRSPAKEKKITEELEGTQTGTQVELAKQPPSRGLSNTVMQVWLWLQFAMVVFIFIWSMARRGPESVLGKASRRRVASATS